MAPSLACCNMPAIHGREALQGRACKAGHHRTALEAPTYATVDSPPAYSRDQ
ncbi:hypothetical protein [Neptuniibacter sp. QD37_11]|uniref:hypothetical protein n=1 Tax=Neptuniibacter sp. QD37_11 TaxID=3398209 RepID=UPI0039F618C7